MKQRLADPQGRKESDNSAESSRTSFAEACETVMKVLVEQQKPFSISGIAKESKLHRRTVEKCIELLANLESKGLEDYKLALHTVDNKKIITLEKRTGLLSYPLDIQKIILRAQHFPMPSSETYQIVNLYLRDAESEKTAMVVEENEVLKKLVKQGQVIASKNGFYLSEEGIVVAEGALELYPFLKQHKPEKEKKQ